MQHQTKPHVSTRNLHMPTASKHSDLTLLLAASACCLKHSVLSSISSMMIVTDKIVVSSTINFIALLVWINVISGQRVFTDSTTLRC